jgi:hypothetical protein
MNGRERRDQEKGEIGGTNRGGDGSGAEQADNAEASGIGSQDSSVFFGGGRA